MHGLVAPGWKVPLGHLVVAQRGVVVVGCRWAAQGVGGPVPGEGTGEDRGAGRLSAVKSALKGAKAMRSFLSGTPWAGRPVMAAVCVLPLPGEETAFVDARYGCWLPVSSPPVSSPPVSSPPASSPPVSSPPVSSPPVSSPPVSSPAVIVNDLWVGHVGRLPAWLASGDGLQPDERAALCVYLSGELCAKRGERQALWSLPERAGPPVSRTCLRSPALSAQLADENGVLRHLRLQERQTEVRPERPLTGAR